MRWIKKTTAVLFAAAAIFAPQAAMAAPYTIHTVPLRMDVDGNHVTMHWDEDEVASAGDYIILMLSDDLSTGTAAIIDTGCQAVPPESRRQCFDTFEEQHGDQYRQELGLRQ